MSDILLEAENLAIDIKNQNTNLTFVDGINFSVKKGEIYGIVGESGCGKSLLAHSIAGLLPENVKISSGRIMFDGVNLLNLNKKEFRKMKGKDISMVFQEPLTSLNPLMKIGRQVSENLKIHTDLTENEIQKETLNILKKVGLNNPEELVNCYPHQLSGGMRQRIMIASAIICKPKLVIADEPTTALDVTIQSQILNLLQDINKTYGCAIIFISHDLGVISRICDRVAVMYFGNIIEEGDTKSVFSKPQHQYTKGLIDSIPTKDKKGLSLVNIPGKVPGITEKKEGCYFAKRCTKAKERCFKTKPEYTLITHNHKVSCFLAGETGE
ncbi:ABC transporter ATP-binding protein [Ruminiclostridium papyrosolvens]|uniref:Nickel import system ATP-binding protein NikD n=1 Tax=Ruminiclostridium papyrosolvens C7 TaxID=1330534 RepID=U4R4W1_9FIRM|nr:ABC transporter ATP-binding protein [Ruminiclostridium papyrosolvens]EPR13560.1 peptide ABC transporter ATP-binding protein [Ruminiclostridium papyrosolvens C7]